MDAAATPPDTKICGGKYGCGELRWIEEFRLLSHGGRTTYCRDCEREFDRFRNGWPSKFAPIEDLVGLKVPEHGFYELELDPLVELDTSGLSPYGQVLVQAILDGWGLGYELRRLFNLTAWELRGTLNALGKRLSLTPPYAPLS